MKLFTALIGLQVLMLSVSATTFLMQDLVEQSMKQQAETLANRYSGCTWDNVSVRKEWGTLTAYERQAYITAVLCLQHKAAASLKTVVPGARSRFDDFLAVHINQTFIIHNNAQFLPWHRYFTWAYEKALRDECGYEGYQPYWDWPKYAQDPANSPLFSGSPFSISGNGVSIPHGPYTYTMPRVPSLVVTFPPGTGGGCIYDGPFANMTVNLGPVNSNGSFPGYIGSGTGLDYNPRCLSRDIGPEISQHALTYQNVTDLITHSPDYLTFTTILAGVHAAGHGTIGGSTGVMTDLFTSPGDLAFYFHHAMIDRVWTIWQNQEIETRQNQLQGSPTWFNVPPSPNITLSYKVDFGVLAPEEVEVGTFMSTLDGPFCYVYE